jgi:hypothetical protein
MEKDRSVGGICYTSKKKKKIANFRTLIKVVFILFTDSLFLKKRYLKSSSLFLSFPWCLEKFSAELVPRRRA